MLARCNPEVLGVGVTKSKWLEESCDTSMRELHSALSNPPEDASLVVVGETLADMRRL